MLGNTLESIAYEKGGIFKHGVKRVLSTPQKPGPWAVLEECATEAGLRLEQVEPLMSEILLGLPGEHQRTNAALAIELCETIAPVDSEQMNTAIKRALEITKWPGRCEELEHSGIQFLVGQSP